MFPRKAYYLKKVFETLRYDRSEIDIFQRNRLEEVIGAAQETGFYRENYDLEEVRPGELTDDLLIDTDAMRIQSENNELGEEYKIRETSGTSGEPAGIAFSRQGHDWISAIYLRTLYLQGYRPGRKIVQSEVKEKELSTAGNIVTPTSFIDPTQELERQIEDIIEKDPDVIRYLPQVLLAICKRMDEEQRKAIDPELILTYGELLTTRTRDYIEEALEAPVKDQYGTTEFGIVAWECPDGGYHIAEDSVRIEAVDDHGESIEGEIGNAAVTGLINTTTPLIRYRLGDVIEPGDETSCSCDTSFRKIRKIRGRKQEIISNSEGEKVFPDQIIDRLAGIEGLIGYRLIAREGSGFTLEFVPGNDSGPGKETIRERLVSELSLKPLNLKKIDSVPQTDGGKIRCLDNRRPSIEL